MRLMTYFRSSAAWRVRIALNLKGIGHELVPVHLTRGGGEQHASAYRAVNPQCLVPALILLGDADETDDEVLVQSPAILEYLEEVHPEPPLLPSAPLARAHVRAVMNIVACDIHPLNNLRVLQYLRNTLGCDEEAVTAWYRHWVTLGFDAIEALIEPRPFCFGDTPTLADVCLVPQVFNARRFDVDLAPYPNIRAVDETCAGIDAFARAHPSRQPDAE